MSKVKQGRDKNTKEIGRSSQGHGKVPNECQRCCNP